MKTGKWDKKEDDFLRNLNGPISKNEIVSLLNRSIHAINSRYKYLKGQN